MRFPLASVLFGYITGIIVEYHLWIRPFWLTVVSFIVSGISIWYYLRNARYFHPGGDWRWWFWTAAVAVGLGASITSWALYRPGDSIMAFAGKRVRLEGLVCAYPDRRKDRQYLVLAVKEVYVGREKRPVRGRVRLTVDDPSLEAEPGDRIVVTTRLQVPEAAGNPGEFCYQSYLLRRGIVLTGFAGASDIVRFSGKGQSLLRVLWRLREAVSARWKHWLGDRAYLGLSLVLGIRSELPAEKEALFRKVGVSHFLAVSGLHVGILAGLCSWLLQAVGISSRTVSFCLIVVLAAYGSLLGWPSSVTRAAIMAGSAAVAGFFSRRRDSLISLPTAAGILLLYQPLLLFDAGFQLTFAATGGILATSARFCGRPWNPVARGIVVSLAAQAATAPLVAFHFGTFHPWAVLATVFLSPLIFLILVSVLFLVPVSLVRFLAVPLALLTKAECGLLDSILSAITSLPCAQVYTVLPTPGFLILYYVLLGWGLLAFPGLWFRNQLLLRALVLKLIGAGAVGVVVWAGILGLSRPALEVTFVDVGQGDAVLLRTRSGALLVDGGGGGNPQDKYYFDVGEKVLLPALRAKGVRHLNAVILTHPHADHFQGLRAVLENLPVDVVVDNGVVGKWEYEVFRRLADLCFHTAAFEGDTIKAGNLHLSVLNPSKEWLGALSINDGSLVIRTVHGGVSLLLTGDIEIPAQARLLSAKHHLRASILKVPHHGALSSFSPAFLAAVGPEVAVVTGGQEWRQQPHPLVLRALERQGCQVYETRRDGAVTVRVGEGGFTVTTYRKTMPYVDWWQRKGIRNEAANS